jgi:hypothetical protein
LSGCSSIAFQATIEPQSWPTIAAFFSPSTSTRAAMSPVVWTMS